MRIDGDWFSSLVVLLISLAVVATSTGEDGSRVVSYETPIAAAGAPDYTVRVNTRQVFVHHSQVAAFASFSFSGQVDVEITPSTTVDAVTIRPLSFGITPERDGNTIRFRLTEPRHLSLEINEDTRRPLFLFADALETNIPKRDTPGVHYFEAGRIHQVGVVTLEDNDTVYIEGGAVVRGAFEAREARNVRILGRGILDGTGYRKGEQRMVQLTDCSDVSLQGITILNSGHWTVVVENSQDIDIHNLKIIGWRDWDDGIDICGSHDISVDGCFIRTKDDCVAIKSVAYDWGVLSVDHDAHGITVENSVLWNGEWGNALEIGFETRTTSIRDIVFRNIDIIHVEGSEGTLSIHNGDRASVRNILYEDLRIERVEGFLFDLKILHSRYSKDLERGQISNIMFNQITVGGERFPPSIIQGFDENHRIDDVRFSDVTIQGKPITSLEDGNFTSSHCRRITFR